jgi:hypothetical protein
MVECATNGGELTPTIWYASLLYMVVFLNGPDARPEVRAG